MYSPRFTLSVNRRRERRRGREKDKIDQCYTFQCAIILYLIHRMAYRCSMPWYCSENWRPLKMQINTESMRGIRSHIIKYCEIQLKFKKILRIFNLYKSLHFSHQSSEFLKMVIMLITQCYKKKSGLSQKRDQPILVVIGSQNKNPLSAGRFLGSVRMR